ncbi:MAG: hypothetical protein JWM11_932 [Planctomycetaceae bacterium]|nr:hypothetical protein [Planctomycetaceae bacterium]
MNGLTRRVEKKPSTIQNGNESFIFGTTTLSRKSTAPFERRNAATIALVRISLQDGLGIAINSPRTNSTETDLKQRYMASGTRFLPAPKQHRDELFPQIHQASLPVNNSIRTPCRFVMASPAKKPKFSGSGPVRQCASPSPISDSCCSSVDPPTCEAASRWDCARFPGRGKDEFLRNYSSRKWGRFSTSLRPANG